MVIVANVGVILVGNQINVQVTRVEIAALFNLEALPTGLRVVAAHWMTNS